MLKTQKRKKVTEFSLQIKRLKTQNRKNLKGFSTHIKRMKIKPLSSLSLEERGNDITIQVQVNRKWDYKGGDENGEILHVDMILTDSQGSAAYAEINDDQIAEKRSLLDIHKVYEISRFQIAPAKTKYMPIDSPWMIKITQYTSIKICVHPPSTFPSYVYRLVPYNDVDPYSESSAKKFHDVLGIIMEISEIRSVQLPKQQTTTVIRDVIIKDLSECTMKVTLWGDRAREFSVTPVYDSEKENPIVVLFVGCLPRIFRGQIYLSGGEACHWYFNPNIDEAQPYYDRSSSHKLALQLPSSSTQEPPSHIAEPREHKTLKELMDMIPFDLSRDKGCVCTVTISEICSGDWWFPACPKCLYRTNVSSTGYECTKCGSTGHKLRYKLSFMARDETGEAKMFCFDDAARNIIGKSCESIVPFVTESSRIPPDLAAIISMKFTFLVVFTKSSYDGKEKVLQVKSVITAHGRVNKIPDIPKGTGPTAPSTPAKCPVISVTPDSPSVALSTTTPQRMNRALTYPPTTHQISMNTMTKPGSHQDTPQSNEGNIPENKQSFSQFESPTKRAKYESAAHEKDEPSI